MIRCLALIFWLSPACALAQSLPAFYDLNGLADGDSLNVRAGPSTATEIIGKLGPETQAVEVVTFNDTREWGQINIGDRSGWVALQFMQRAPGQPDEGLPSAFSCLGTEPFWSFDVAEERSASFNLSEVQTDIDALIVLPSQNRTDRFALFGDAPETIFTSMVNQTQCTDGMSDRVYGLSIDMLVTDNAGVNVYSGCCSALQVSD